MAELGLGEPLSRLLSIALERSVRLFQALVQLSLLLQELECRPGLLFQIDVRTLLFGKLLLQQCHSPCFRLKLRRTLLARVLVVLHLS